MKIPPFAGIACRVGIAAWLLATWCGVSQAQDALDPGGGSGQIVAEGCVIAADGRVDCGLSASGFDPASPERFASLAHGDGAGLCAVRSDGEAVCKSLSATGAFPPPPPGPWRMLAVSGFELCGVRMDGALACWGETSGRVATLPADGPFRSVSIAWNIGCALRVDGTLACWTRGGWGGPWRGQPPSGRFLKVEVSSSHACALRSDGRIFCWGVDAEDRNSPPDASGFLDLSVGQRHACGLGSQGTVTCWGVSDGTGAPVPMPSPRGTFTALASRGSAACGRRTEGPLVCWTGSWPQGWVPSSTPSWTALAAGDADVCALDADGIAHCLDPESPLAPPPRRYLSLAFGRDFGCGLGFDRRTQCWGASPAPVPTEPMQAIAVGRAHVCGLREDGGIACWGDNAAGQTEAPPGTYLRVVAGGDFSCALSTGGLVVCWGTGPAVTGIPVGGGFDRLYAGESGVCAGRGYGQPECWGRFGAEPSSSSSWSFGYTAAAIGDGFACTLQPAYAVCKGGAAFGIPFLITGSYFAISASARGVCLLQANGTVVCEGQRRFLATMPTGRAGRGGVIAGARHSCNAGIAGGIDCWGSDAQAQRMSPAIAGAHAAAGGDHACATGADNMLQCWGDGQRDGNLPPPGLTVRDVDLGQFNGCAVGADSHIVCWGWNANGQGTPPEGAFRRVATGLNHSCGVRDDGTLACWGYGADGQTAAPAGTYLTVDVGERHSCAIAGDGALRCWGLDSEGQATPPGGIGYRTLSSGAFHNCAIRGDGGLACWGRNDEGQSTPPPGRFVAVAAGDAHACAVRDDGARLCWGRNAEGQAPALSVLPEALPLVQGEGTYLPLRAEGSGGYVPRQPRFRLVAGSLPPNATLTPDGLLQGVNSARGDYPFTIEVRDANGFVATRDYILRVRSQEGASPPSIVARVSGVQGQGGWYRSDLRVEWLVTDPADGPVVTEGCEPRSITVDVSFTQLHCIARSAGGETDNVVFYARDATPPLLTANMPPPVLPVGAVHDFAMTASDALSGLIEAACTPVVTSRPGSGTAVCSATDRAGNVTSMSATYTVVQSSPVKRRAMPGRLRWRMR